MIVTDGTPYVAVVPARAGSKGVPRKNLRPVAGRPLFVWSIEHARRARAAMRVVVSTDDPEIAEIAREAGAEVPSLRPADLATDEAPTEPGVIHAVGSLPGAGALEHVVLLQPTSPIRDDGSLDAAIALYETTGVASLVSVVDAHPFLWTGTAEAGVAQYDVEHRPRRQDIAPTDRRYRENGSIYITARHHLFSTGNRLDPRPAMFLMQPHEGLDVDDEIDLLVADVWLRGRHAD